MKVPEILLVGAVFALGLRVIHLFGRYMQGAADAQRFHVESWALILVALAVILRIVRSRDSSPGRSPFETTNAPAAWMWLVCCALALGLYWPALSVGLLSDDYVLVEYAAGWRLGPVTEALFRPIPLFAWALLLHTGAGTAALHALNILLHGSNAYLAARLVAGFGIDRFWSFLAGLFWLTAPLAPEAVVWTSGVFDLSATALVLLCILIARRYDPHPSAATRVQLVAAGVAALLSKETAAVAGGLVLVDAWARNALSRRLVQDCSILLAIAGTFAIVRLTAAFGAVAPPLSKYLVQRALFGSFGALAVPWHIDVTLRLPWLAVAGVAAIVALIVAFAADANASPARTRIALAGIASVLLPIAPIFPILFVAPDLQQARYLYLSGFGWTVLMTVLAAEQRHRIVSLAVFCMLIGLGAFGTVAHQRPWIEAGRLRDRVERSAIDAGLTNCPRVTLADLPDSVSGAYVFRNGGREAFARDLRLDATIADRAGTGPCAFRWDEARQSFVRSADQ